MLDIRTILIITIATCLLLAGCLWVSIGGRSGERTTSLHKVTGSLAMFALAYSMFAGRGNLPDWVSVIVANTAFMLALTAQADAVITFYGRRMPAWWHLAPAIVVAIVFSVLDAYQHRVIASGILFGGLSLALAILTHRLHAGSGRQSSHALMVGGYIAGAVAFLVRGVTALVDPNSLQSMTAPGVLQTITFFTGYAVVIVTSVGFLVMHKDRLEEAAQRLALTDPLTGTFNRRTFLDLAEKEIARAIRTTSPLTLVMLDLDHFKRINDQYGHLTGDAVLKRFSTIVQDCLRKEDLLVRYGGEEFCVLLPNLDVTQAQALAERIRQAVESSSFTSASATSNDVRRIPVTVSAGVARYLQGADARDLLNGDDSLSAFINRADEALYAAKSNGRNRVMAYPENATIAMMSRSQRIRATVNAAS